MEQTTRDLIDGVLKEMTNEQDVADKLSRRTDEQSQGYFIGKALGFLMARRILEKALVDVSVQEVS